MAQQTTYLVTVTPQSWDDRQQAFISGYLSPDYNEVFDHPASALAAFARLVGEAEKYARHNRGPVQVEVMQRADETCDWEPLEINGPDGKPFYGSHYYPGKDCTGMFALMAHREYGTRGGPKYQRDMLTCIDGRHGQPTGEWELRHADDRVGALYAEEIFATTEEARQYFEEHPELINKLDDHDRRMIGLDLSVSDDESGDDQ